MPLVWSTFALTYICLFHVKLYMSLITVLSLSERKILSSVFVHMLLASPQFMCAIHHDPVL